MVKKLQTYHTYDVTLKKPETNT